MALPAVITAMWVLSFELTLDAPFVVPEPGSTLADEVQNDDIVRGFVHLRAGEDPDAPVLFSNDKLTGGRELRLTPLIIAAAYGREDSVAMLMSSGAHLDAPGNRFAVCLARRMGYEGLAERMVEEAGPAGAPSTCPATAPPDEAPLSVYAE